VLRAIALLGAHGHREPWAYPLAIFHASIYLLAEVARS